MNIKLFWKIWWSRWSWTYWLGNARIHVFFCQEHSKQYKTKLINTSVYHISIYLVQKAAQITQQRVKLRLSREMLIKRVMVCASRRVQILVRSIIGFIISNWCIDTQFYCFVPWNDARILLYGSCILKYDSCHNKVSLHTNSKQNSRKTNHVISPTQQQNKMCHILIKCVINRQF